MLTLRMIPDLPDFERTFPGSSLLSVGRNLLCRQPEIELSGDQVDHGLEVADRAVSARLGLGGLHQAVDALDQAVSDLAVEPAQDPVPMTLDGVRGIDDRLEAAMGRPEIPCLEVTGSLV